MQTPQQKGQGQYGTVKATVLATAPPFFFFGKFNLTKC